MANNQQNINGQIDFASLGAQLATTIADAFNRGTTAGISNMGRSLTGSDFLDTLNAQMAEFADKQKTSVFNTKVQNEAMKSGLDTRRVELKLLGEQVVEENNLAIAEAERAGNTQLRDQLIQQNEEIRKSVVERQKQLKIEIEQEKLQKHQLEASERIKKIDQERAELMEKINEKAEIFKQIFTDKRMAFAALTAGAMKFGEALTESYKELKEEGLSVTQALGESFTSFSDSVTTSLSSGFAVSAESIRKARKAVLDTGGSLHEAEEAGKGAALMAEKYGGSLENAGKAIGNLQKIPGLTKEAAKNTAEFGAKMAIAANVPADTVTKAVANNMDAAAKAGPSMTKSFATAAINAQRIGVQFATITGLADKLLDFESSINAQMEASVLLGKEINLDRAREAALQGDYATVQKEILKQVGSEAEFTKMNVLQKQKLAEAMGVTVGDLAKMVKGQGELSDGTKLEAEGREKSFGFLSGMVDLGAKHASTLLGMLPSLASMILQYKTLNVLQGNQGGFFKNMKNMFGMGKTSFADKRQMVLNRQNQNLPGGGGGGDNQSGFLDKLSKIDAKKMLSTAAAIAAVGAAIMMIGKGIQFASEGLATLVSSFKGLSDKEMEAALSALIVVMLGFTIMVTALASASTVAAGPLLALGAAFLMIGLGIGAAGLGIGYMVEQLGKLPFKDLATLPLALQGIALGLTSMGLAGILAIPTITAMTKLGVAAPKMSGLQSNSSKSTEGEKENPIVKAVLELGAKIDKLHAQPVVVSVDGTAIVKAVRKDSNLSKTNTSLGK